MKLPWLPIYDVIVALLVIVPLGLIFFSSAFLYNKLCDGELLTSDESKVCLPIKSKRAFLLLFVVGMIVAGIFYLLITHDNFDVSLILIVPPLVVAILCELKNGFIPILSVVLCGLCVLGRIVYYCVFYGIGYGLSIFLGFLIAFAVIFIPKIIFDRNNVDIPLVLLLSLLASCFSPIFALIFVAVVYFIRVVGYEIPNFVSEKRRGRPIFTFELPVLTLSAVVFAAMLLI